MVEILDDRDNNALIQRDDGSVELITWTPLNELVYKHGLSGVLVTGEEIYSVQDGDKRARLTPNDDATEFTLRVETENGTEEVHIGNHEKSKLLDTMQHMMDKDEKSVQPLLELAGDLLDYDVNPKVVDQFADKMVFADAVEVTDDGWLIHGHLLLTYDNEFYHPHTDRTQRDGTVLSDNANKVAYKLSFGATPDEGQSELSEFSLLGDDDATVEFVARAIWAVKNAPRVAPE